MFEAISWHATKGLAAVFYPCMVLQASQVRKSNYVPEKGLDYEPDKNHTSTVYAGTCIQQVHSDYLFADVLTCQCCIPIPRSMLTMWCAALDLFGVAAALFTCAAQRGQASAICIEYVLQPISVTNFAS